MNRSNVSEPVREAVNLMPPSFLRISAHSFAVEESIQMGEVLRAKTPSRFSTSDFLGSRFASAAVGLFVEINRAVLLAAAADGEDFAERDAVLFHLREQQVQRRGPQQRRAVFDERVAVGQHAVSAF